VDILERTGFQSPAQNSSRLFKVKAFRKETLDSRASCPSSSEIRRREIEIKGPPLKPSGGNAREKNRSFAKRTYLLERKSQLRQRERGRGGNFIDEKEIEKVTGKREATFPPPFQFFREDAKSKGMPRGKGEGR